MKPHRRTKKVSLGLQSFVSLQTAADRVSSDVYTRLTRYRLTMSQFSVLQALHTEGPMYQIALARHIGKTTGNLTTVIDNLEKRGLVKRVREKRDRRYYKVEPTPEGRKLIRKAYPAHIRQVERVMAKLTAEEQNMLSTLCTRLLETENEE